MTVVQLQSKSPGSDRSKLVAALDIGSTKVCCLIAQAQPPKHRMPGSEPLPVLRVLGLGYQASRGVRSGSIVDVDEAERAIRLAVDAAERMGQQTISDIWVNVSGGRPRSIACSAAIKTANGEVSAPDIDAVTGAALARAEIGRRAILHVAPVQYRLDDAKGIKSPGGMFGETLGLDLNVVTAEAAHLRNLALAVERCHLSVAGTVIAPYAAAKSVLSEDERQLGVTLIDMGGATTGIAVFHDGNLIHGSLIPIGGQHITNDIAKGLSTSIAHAERMKTLWGSAIAASIDEREMVAVPLLGERGVDTVRKVPKSMLTGIIRPRLEETFELVRDRLAEGGANKLGASRVVLTGGASQLNGIREMATHWLERPVRIGAPLPLAGAPEPAHSASFAVCTGLLLYALRPDRVHLPAAGAQERLEQQNRGYIRRVGRWIADSF